MPKFARCWPSLTRLWPLMADASRILVNIRPMLNNFGRCWPKSGPNGPTSEDVYPNIDRCSELWSTSAKFDLSRTALSNADQNRTNFSNKCGGANRGGAVEPFTRRSVETSPRLLIPPSTLRNAGVGAADLETSNDPHWGCAQGGPTLRATSHS